MTKLESYLDRVKGRCELASRYDQSSQDWQMIELDLPRLERWLREAVGKWREVAVRYGGDWEDEFKAFLARVEKEVGG